MNSTSWNSATKWKDIVEENCDYIDTKPIPIVLVQNKCDLISKLGKLEDYMNLEVAEKEAKSNKFLALFQTSAKNNQNLDAVFETLTENILQRNLINDELINFEDKGKKSNNNNNNGNQRVPDPNIRLNNQNNRSSPSGGSGKSGCC
jgi:GTPase SAR1 family protein